MKRRILALSNNGVMPSCAEMRASGENALACAVTRKRGMWRIATEMGLSVKGSESKFGIRIQERVATLLRARGFAVLEHSVKHPFDLTVSGARVDVKAAHYKEYPHKHGGTLSRGYFFALNKVPATCDVYILCCCNDSDEIGDTYYVPAPDAPQRTVTIAPTGKRFERYRNNLSFLDQATVGATG